MLECTLHWLRGSRVGQGWHSSDTPPSLSRAMTSLHTTVSTAVSLETSSLISQVLETPHQMKTGELMINLKPDYCERWIPSSPEALPCQTCIHLPRTQVFLENKVSEDQLPLFQFCLLVCFGKKQLLIAQAQGYWSEGTLGLWGLGFHSSLLTLRDQVIIKYQK